MFLFGEAQPSCFCRAVKNRRNNPYAKPDAFTAKAKQEGYPARSVFKLEEIDRRVRLLKGGQHVLDLGASPGSWAKYISQKIGQSGRLLAVDLKPMSISLPPGCVFILGDALSLENESLKTFAPYDVVVSDMAPSTSGTRMQDQARSYELFMRAVEVSVNVTKPGGHFVGKIFMGEDFPYARKKIKDCYEEEKIIRPEGTRTNSYEVFLIGLGLRARPT